MKDIVRIDSNAPQDLLRIELFLSNVCNYKCWYCFPGSNEGTHRWPNLEPLTSNLCFLFDYYKEKLGKKRFHIHIIGGEPTVWPEIERFTRFFKDNYRSIISISTNGSRTLRWWQEYGKNFDHVMISCHHQFINTEHTIEVADCLYKQNVDLTAMVLMDPTQWDQCLSIIDRLKNSKHKWPLIALEVSHSTISYTEDQKKFISDSVKRMPNMFWWLKNNKMISRNPKLTFENFTTKKVDKNWISLNGLNRFEGWSCSLGIETLYVNKDGNLQGACGETLYDLDFKYNVFDEKFKETFAPEIKETTCRQEGCFCQPEINATTFVKQDATSIVEYPLHRYTSL